MPCFICECACEQSVLIFRLRIEHFCFLSLLSFWGWFFFPLNSLTYVTGERAPVPVRRNGRAAACWWQRLWKANAQDVYVLMYVIVVFGVALGPLQRRCRSKTTQRMRRAVLTAQCVCVCVFPSVRGRIERERERDAGKEGHLTCTVGWNSAWRPCARSQAPAVSQGQQSAYPGKKKKTGDRSDLTHTKSTHTHVYTHMQHISACMDIRRNASLLTHAYSIHTYIFTKVHNVHSHSFVYMWTSLQQGDNKTHKWLLFETLCFIFFLLRHLELNKSRCV